MNFDTDDREMALAWERFTKDIADLQAENERWERGYYEEKGLREELEAENERLRAQLQLSSPGCLHDPCSPALDDYIHELEADRDRFVAALERIADGTDGVWERDLARFELGRGGGEDGPGGEVSG